MPSGRIGMMAVLALAAGLSAAGGCSSDKPHDYGRERPSVNEIDSRDRGLQSADVNHAADQMAADLLSDPQLNASKTQWTIVTTSVTDRTLDRRGRLNYDIFLQALQGRIAELGRGRITLIANRDQFYDLRNKEREGGGRDEFGQTGGGTPAAAGAVNPDYALTGVVLDMPNRGTNYYQFEFRIQDLRNRTIPWIRLYSVKVAR